LHINADKSDVYIYEPLGSEGLAYDLSLNNGEVKFPDDKKITELARTTEFRRFTIRPNQEQLGTITASMTFGDLYLAKQTKVLERRKGR
jgi:hypothetical protein